MKQTDIYRIAGETGLDPDTVRAVLTNSRVTRASSRIAVLAVVERLGLVMPAGIPTIRAT